MYKIIGSDQKEYGPVSSDQIQQWIGLGRVNAQTKAQADGGEWKTLGDFPEFAATFNGGTVSKGPPPLTPVSTPTQPAKTNGLAIASLILGILGLCGITALIGLILGLVSMRQIRKSKGAMGGGGIALAGTIISAVFLLFAIPLGAAMILPALFSAKQRALTIQCMNNARQLSVATLVYAGDHEEHFPAATNWCDALKAQGNINDWVFKCSAAHSTEGCDYAYNSQLAGLDIKSANSQTVLFFESSNGWNQSGGLEMVLSRPHHRNGARQQTVTVSFVDGHSEEVPWARISTLRWSP